MSIAPIEKFIILMEDVALPRKIFMGKQANLVKFIWFVKYFFNVFVADVNLKKSVFQTDMPPSFLLWRIESRIRNYSYYAIIRKLVLFASFFLIILFSSISQM